MKRDVNLGNIFFIVYLLELPRGQIKIKSGELMGFKSIQVIGILVGVLTIACQKNSLSDRAVYNEGALANMAQLIAEKRAAGADPAVIRELEEKFNSKRTASALSRSNQLILAAGMKENTKFHSLKGKYKILVIPVQFSDVKIERPDYYANSNSPNSAYQALFGNGPSSLRTFYRHQSLGAFDVDGVISPMVAVKGKLEEYGEAVVGENDKAAQLLVKQALQGVMEIQKDSNWWQQFDQWDLQDYDGDSNFYEADGFIDAVVLVYAGKPQSSCQRVFDPKGERPASKDYPEGPRKKAAVECFNRLWPHRSAVQLAKDDPDYSEKGPKIEGLQRPSLNGFKITEGVFALDYNMQAEYSDLATFIHEFGHSLTLPDVYATRSADNSTGAWEVMSSTSTQNAQELSSWSRLVLGWLSPKIVTPSQRLTSLYLGTMNYLDAERREDFRRGSSPDYVSEVIDGQEHIYDVLSVVPGSDEPVYRSAVVAMPTSQEARKVIDFRAENGKHAVYTAKYDGQSRAMKIKLDVPKEGEGSAELQLDVVYEIETGTNFDSTEEPIKVVTHFDMATVSVDGKEVDRWELISGDKDQDSLVETNPACEVGRVKELRLKVFAKQASDTEKKEFTEKLAVCRKPQWLTKKYDLAAYRGKTVDLEIRYTTDPGYTDMGVLIDNIQLVMILKTRLNKNLRVVLKFYVKGFRI